MKFGKRYQETLDAPGIPAEWRATAIEYRKLKKVINRVASELAELGLTSDVLKDLLESNAEDAPTLTIEEIPADSQAAAGPSGSRDVDEKESGTEVRVESVEAQPAPPAPGESDHARLRWDSSDEEANGKPGGLSARAKGKRRRGSRRRATASYELAGTSENPEPRIRLVFASDSSHSDSSGETSDFLKHQSSDTETSIPSSTGAGRFEEVDSSDEDSAAKNEGNDDSESASAASPASEDFSSAGPKESTLLKRMYGLSVHSDDELDWAEREFLVEPEGRRKSDETVRHQEIEPELKRKVVQKQDAETQPHEPVPDTASEDADDEGAERKPRRRRHHHPRRHRKEVFIELNSDTEFLTLLAHALGALAALQAAQKQQFAQKVELLAREVSNVSSPSRPRTDLYVWREIFTLWIEAQIFESDREKDRGERTVEEAEAKLDWFVDQVAQRKLAKQMKHKESREALERFIKLNVQLLDLKRFQLANEEAARKILKKHDKRTALTASHGFPEFIAAASTLSTTSGSGDRRVLVLPGFPSLPHIMLTTLTNTLLPIIPQLEDYECAICGEVAFKPIKLDCGHKFCVRCLVKMQKRGQDACPQCRSPVVLRANAANLDRAMQQYLQLWFPREVKAKEKENSREAAREELEEMGLTHHKCTIS